MIHLLLPTDFSGNAVNAAIYGMQLFSNQKVSITLLHVYRPEDEENCEFSEEFDLLKKELQKYGVSEEDIVCVCEKGELTHCIDRITNKTPVDFIVMGTKGTNPNTIFIGSNTSNTIQSTLLPVIVVPKEAKYSQINKIAFAADFKKISSSEILAPMVQIAKKFNSEILILNVFEDAVPLDYEKNKEATILNELFDEVKHSYHFIINPDINEAIEMFITLNQVDLVVMISRTSSFMQYVFNESHTKRTVETTEFPLLIMHDSA